MDQYNRRVKFQEGKQRELIIKASGKYGSIKNLSNELRIPYSTLKKYAQEEFLIPENLFKSLLLILKIKENELDFNYLDRFWSCSASGKKGMATFRKKYSHKIPEWSRKAIKKLSISNSKKINIPEVNEKLAEFIGVYLGDGTMTKYLLRISGDYRYDLHYFYYLNNLIKDLFGISGSINQKHLKR